MKGNKMAKILPKTKAQIITALAEEADITKVQSKAVLEKLVDLAYAGSKTKDGFTIPGLGKLIVQQRKARMGRNPATGESIKIPAKKVLKFRISKVAKDAVTPPKK
jgi:DNA-binding protein HU-beta